MRMTGSFVIERCSRCRLYRSAQRHCYGAENILIPERKTEIDTIIKQLAEKERRHKLVNLIVVAEGDEFWRRRTGGQSDPRTPPLLEVRLASSVISSVADRPVAWTG